MLIRRMLIVDDNARSIGHRRLACGRGIARELWPPS